MSIGELAGRIKQVLADGFPGRVIVTGEISNLSARQHWFFTLKDPQASIRCVMFASAAAKVRFDARNGQAVIAHGRVDFYDAQGNLQLYIDRLEPVGLGTLEQQLRALLEELRDKGYFDPEHKQPLPAMPTTVAVVTSRTAAALQDVIDTAKRRWPGCRLLLFDVRVQGDDAAPQIANALRALSAHGPDAGIDAIILTRGGGSLEDLWAFNERIVAQAVYDCQLPIVAAIGHETDTTVAELVADVRCATPTQAAMTLIPDRAGLSHQIGQLASRLTLVQQRHLTHARQRIDAVARHMMFTRPTAVLEQKRDVVRDHAKRLTRAMAGELSHKRNDLDAHERHLRAVGPTQVLKRGYSYTLDASGQVITKAQGVADGDAITTVLADGKLHSVVTKGKKETSAKRSVPGSTTKPAPKPAATTQRSGKRSRKKPSPGPGLFDS